MSGWWVKGWWWRDGLRRGRGTAGLSLRSVITLITALLALVALIKLNIGV